MSLPDPFVNDSVSQEGKATVEPLCRLEDKSFERRQEKQENCTFVGSDLLLVAAAVVQNVKVLLSKPLDTK